MEDCGVYDQKSGLDPHCCHSGDGMACVLGDGRSAVGVKSVRVLGRSIGYLRRSAMGLSTAYVFEQIVILCRSGGTGEGLRKLLHFIGPVSLGLMSP